MARAEREFRACMEVLSYAIFQARAWGWQDDVDAEQLADLMDAIHNVPSLVQHWEDCDQGWLKDKLESYKRRWSKSDGTCLLEIYEEALIRFTDQ